MTNESDKEIGLVLRHSISKFRNNILLMKIFSSRIQPVRGYQERRATVDIRAYKHTFLLNFTKSLENPSF